MTKKNLIIKQVEYPVYGEHPLLGYPTNFILATRLKNRPCSHDVGSCQSAETLFDDSLLERQISLFLSFVSKL